MGFEIAADSAYQNLVWVGLQMTVQIAVFSYLLAFLIGNVIAAMRVSPVPILSRVGTLYTVYFRNTPLIVLAILFWVGGGRTGWPFGRTTTAIVVLGMYTGAYVAEALRSGINAVPPGQAEAARAIGLPFTGVVGRIVLPQAIRTVIPPLGNLWIANLKNTSVFLVIGINELTRSGYRIGLDSSRYVAALSLVGIVYLLMVYGSAQVIKLIERRTKIAR